MKTAKGRCVTYLKLEGSQIHLVYVIITCLSYAVAINKLTSSLKTSINESHHFPAHYSPQLTPEQSLWPKLNRIRIFNKASSN